MGDVEKEGETGAEGRARSHEVAPSRGGVLPGDLEKCKYFPASLSGKKPREGWLGKVLLLEMVMAFECMIVYLSLEFFGSLRMRT